MVDTTDGAEARPATIAHEAVGLVQRWLAESARGADGSSPRQDPAAERLAGVLSDPDGLDFAVGFVDGVARPQDLFVAGYNLQRVAKRIPVFLPWYMRFAIWLGGVFGPVLPWVVIPIARRVLRRMVGHLVVDATPEKLGPAIARLRSPDPSGGPGARLNLNLLGEAVLGEKEALRRLEGTRTLLARDDVDYVSIKVSSIASQLSMWAFDETVERVVERLTPLYELAAASPTPKFINLDMEEYRDLDLTMAVFTGILGKPQLLGLEAGIVLQAYLPDALDALQTLTEWATRRRAQGGAPIKIRVVKGANLAMERVDAAIHGWPLAPYGTKQSTDANYKRVLDWALTPEHADAVKIGVAGHNLFDIAYAWLLAQKRGVTERIDFEMLLGMATAQAEAVERTVGGLLLYTPVVDPREFDVAISYLIRRLEENASPENFMSAVFQLDSDPELFEREKQRFLASVAELEADAGPRGTAPVPNRQQDRTREWEEASAPSFTRPPAPAPVTPAATDEQGLTSVVLGLTRGSGGIELPTPNAPAGAVPAEAAPAAVPTEQAGDFHNAPDTDPSRAANRAWGRRILVRSAASTIGEETIADAAVRDAGRLDAILGMVAEAGREWGSRSGHERAAVLDRAGHALEANRDRLIEVMAAETGKTIAEADPEVSEAVDFAHYYATRARELDAVQGAQFVPSALTVVAPPWNFPVAIPAGSVLAALAAGSGVIIKPAPQARRSAAVMVEALWESGIPRQLLALVDVAENELGQQLIADRRVDRVILTGSYETAKLFRSWRPDLPLLAETSGKNAIIVTPSADYDLAVSDIVKSAFGHAGQKCSAASLVILVGSVARSERFRNQLVDAVTSLRAGYPHDPTSQMGPLIEPASGKLLHALTTLGAGEEWLVEPRRLDGSGRLWSPGVRTGVQPGSYFHLTEFFGPVLGVMTARDLEEAIRYQNAVEYGLTAGLHSLDSDELALWLDTVEAGNLYVNRGITGAIVRRQPFGGWKRSSVGAGTKAGGPNYLFGLGSWVPEAGHSSSSLHLRGLETRVSDLIESGQSSMDYPSFDLVRRSALSDAIAVATEYHRVTDVSGLGVERNLFRYRPVPVAIRLSEGSSLPELLRVMAAATVARSPFSVSTPVKLPRGMHALLREREIEVVVESDAHWLSRVRARRIPAHRIRLIGGDPVALATALGGSPDVAVYSGPVTPSGRVELLTFLHEQAISITNHRFGNPTHLSDGLL
ncbi:proline dehydrogenase family protein [Leifsonia soli]|uniref:L-glutamate gamma-semialdehyde dehydrogenase n=1 Tax=Leifsonia soli TaxID=582665 RepID=A0A852T3Y7_9MICO|nr:bifunctional proline dehydrogenase/L-glutamate gamma-semialdehyde dehydrogenase [Leifsonia soli]NYD75565.1 RHH-type proline utilization regulon transcriptional repressor/proline dehydrogenase/delta 1-pyrroline-5-carboxylate dehydrogenase [Leifsonia soli]